MSAGYILLINPTGSRWWRFKYLRFGKERGLSFGVYPDVSLALARKRPAQKLRPEGAQPIDHRGTPIHVCAFVPDDPVSKTWSRDSPDMLLNL